MSGDGWGWCHFLVLGIDDSVLSVEVRGMDESESSERTPPLLTRMLPRVSRSRSDSDDDDDDEMSSVGGLNTPERACTVESELDDGELNTPLARMPRGWVGVVSADESIELEMPSSDNGTLTRGAMS